MQVQEKGSASAEVEVELPSSVTSWGPPLLAALGAAVGVAEVAEVWVRCPDGELEGPLPGGRLSWAALTGDPELVALVVPRSRSIPTASSAASAGLDDVDTEEALGDGEQNWRRIQVIFADEPCPAPRILQQVRVNVTFLLTQNSDPIHACVQIGSYKRQLTA